MQDHECRWRLEPDSECSVYCRQVRRLSVWLASSFVTRARSFLAAMLSSVPVSRETAAPSPLSLRRPSSWLFLSWRALATVESQQPVEWSVVSRRSPPYEVFPSRAGRTPSLDSGKGPVRPMFLANYVFCEGS